MPKKAIFRRTNSVKSGPRSKGGGTRNNGWNCLVLAVALLTLPAAALGGFVVGVVAR